MDDSLKGKSKNTDESTTEDMIQEIEAFHGCKTKLATNLECETNKENLQHGSAQQIHGRKHRGSMK
jgi:hypothetical protein